MDWAIGNKEKRKIITKLQKSAIGTNITDPLDNKNKQSNIV